MVFSQDSFANLQHLDQQLFGVFVSALVIVGMRQVANAQKSIRVLDAKNLLADGDGLFAQVFGLLPPTLAVLEVHKVAHPDESVGVLATENAPSDLHGTKLKLL